MSADLIKPPKGTQAPKAPEPQAQTSTTETSTTPAVTQTKKQVTTATKTERQTAFDKLITPPPAITEQEITEIIAEIQYLILGKNPAEAQARTSRGTAFLALIQELPTPTQAEIKYFDSKMKPLAAAIAKEKKAQEKLAAKPQPAAGIAAPTPTVPPSTVIPVKPYPKWWDQLMMAAISLSGPGTQNITRYAPTLNTFISSIILTVDGETKISFRFGALGSTGQMSLGGSNQPMGMVIDMADSPAPCGKDIFSIYSDGSGVNVGGFVVYYQLEAKTTEVIPRTT